MFYIEIKQNWPHNGAFRLYLQTMNNGRKSYKTSIFLTIISISLLLLSGCSSPGKISPKAYSYTQQQQIIAIAKAQLGKPYRYGGKSPRTGFDCSGLINFSYKKAGLKIPRTTIQLYREAYPIKRSQLKKGDLVFFKINKRKISHVGLYLGNNKFIHAPSSGKRVKIANMNDKYWRVRFTRGGRI